MFDIAGVKVGVNICADIWDFGPAEAAREAGAELLLVLQRPDVPLHNNLSENDIREYVTRRKRSGSTRSDLGRRCRDTFASLKKTCRKLGISFWRYLLDRISGANTVPQLSAMIRQRAQEAQEA